METGEERVARERREAWVGDAVLALWARAEVLRRTGRIDTELFLRLTSNQFLTSLGRGSPTAVEAEVGRVFAGGGLAAAEQFLEEVFLPVFERQERNRR